MLRRLFLFIGLLALLFFWPYFVGLSFNYAFEATQAQKPLAMGYVFLALFWPLALSFFFMPEVH